MDKASQLKIIPFQESLKKPSLDLFHKCFPGRARTEEFYDWSFIRNPFGKTMVDLFVDPQNNLVSHYAVRAANSFYSEEYYRTSHSMITMTDSDYAGLGLFPKLAEHLYNRIARDFGVKLVYGFPNLNSHYSITQKLGWTDKFIIPTMKKNLGVGQGVKLPAMTTKLEPLSHFDPKSFDHLWAKVSETSSRFFANARNSDFIKWRFIDSKLHTYKILVLRSSNELNAYAVVKEYQTGAGSEIDLVDLLFDSSVKASDILEAVVSFAKETGASAINTWLPLGTKTYGAGEKMGFIPGLPLTYLGYRLFDKENISLSHLLDAGKWHISMADSDVY